MTRIYQNKRNNIKHSKLLLESLGSTHLVDARRSNITTVITEHRGYHSQPSTTLVIHSISEAQTFVSVIDHIPLISYKIEALLRNT